MEEEIKVNQGPVVDSDVLNEYETSVQKTTNLNYSEGIKMIINGVFADFGVDAVITGEIVGPNVIRYSLGIGRNVSYKAIANVITDIQIRLGGVPVRLDTTSQGIGNIGLEVENKVIETVSFKSLYESLPDIQKHPLAIPLGMKVTGQPVWIDLKDAPHILVCGINGSGMTLFFNTVITSLIMRNSPNDVRLALFDQKMVEFNYYNDMPHLWCPVIRDDESAVKVLKDLDQEMLDRYERMTEANCCSLEEYNEFAAENGLNRLPYIVVVINEYGALVDDSKNIPYHVISLAQKARAAGIHLIVGTQNPSINVVTGVLKVNLPVHIGFMMSNTVDSLAVLGEAGAEKLAGCGDMLVQSHLVSRLGLVRLQGCFIHRTEIKRVVDILKDSYKPLYMIRDKKWDDLSFKIKKKVPEQEMDKKDNPDNNDEDRYENIKEWVMNKDYISISLIQRECSVGFNRAGRYFLRLQEEGIISKETSKRGCKVLKNNEK